MKVALMREVFLGALDSSGRLPALEEALTTAARQGAQLAVLPELPLNRWCPATPEPDPADAEPPEGARAQAQARAAREAGIALVGGSLVLDGERRNRALVWDAKGRPVGRYDKVHLPDEPGFHEVDHYRPGVEPPRRLDLAGLAFGLQLCSDANRPVGTQLLAAQGVHAVLVPRATERATWERWRLALRANALMGACYVLTVNRPGPELGVLIGGPNLAVDPQGQVMVEEDEPLTVVDLDLGLVEAARAGYPGYLARPADLYAKGWAAL